MEKNELIEFLCDVLDDASADPARRVDAGYVLLNHAARLCSVTGVPSDKSVGQALAKSVRAKLRVLALAPGGILGNGSTITMEQRIRAAGGAL